MKQEVKKGEAQILSCLEEDGAPQLYTIEIKALHLDHDNINRGIEIQVTDERLLEKTGGIVQGMSGFPDPPERENYRCRHPRLCK